MILIKKRAYFKHIKSIDPKTTIHSNKKNETV